MKIYHAQCPCCGQWNYNLFLDETEGLFECEACRQVSRLLSYHPENIPVLTSEDWNLQVPNSPAFADMMKKAV